MQVVLVTCSYKDKEFIRIGCAVSSRIYSARDTQCSFRYYIQNEYDEATAAIYEQNPELENDITKVRPTLSNLPSFPPVRYRSHADDR